MSAPTSAPARTWQSTPRLREDPDHAFDTVEQHYSPIVTSLATMAKPVVAAVEGVCVGAGLGFAPACDLRVVSTGATLATALSSIGLTCDSVLSHTFSREIGDARARELALLAEPLTCRTTLPPRRSGAAQDPPPITARR